jgi:VanZ family protein
MKFFIPAIGWVILSTILFTLPGSSLPTEDWMSKIWIDKWVHIGLFVILTFLLCRGIYKGKTTPEKYKQYFIICGLTGLAYGIIIEFVQKYFVPFRSFELTDILMDGMGSFLGVLYSMRVYIKK